MDLSPHEDEWGGLWMICRGCHKECHRHWLLGPRAGACGNHERSAARMNQGSRGGGKVQTVTWSDPGLLRKNVL